MTPIGSAGTRPLERVVRQRPSSSSVALSGDQLKLDVLCREAAQPLAVTARVNTLKFVTECGLRVDLYDRRGVANPRIPAIERVSVTLVGLSDPNDSHNVVLLEHSHSPAAP